MVEQLWQLATEVAAELEAAPCKIVLAESCTGGLIAAALVSVPGMSQFLCGSLVTYQSQAKTAWLEIDPKLIAEHSAESPEVTATMAIAALEKTPVADVSLAITGHLSQPSNDRGRMQVFVAIASREDGSAAKVNFQTDFRLATASRAGATGGSGPLSAGLL